MRTERRERMRPRRTGPARRRSNGARDAQLRADLQMALGSHARLPHARNERVRPVLERTREPDPDAVLGGAVRRQPHRRAADRDGRAPRAKQVRDDLRPRNLAPVVQDASTEDVRATNTSVRRRRVDPRDDGVRAGDHPQRREGRRLRHRERTVGLRRPRIRAEGHPHPNHEHCQDSEKRPQRAHQPLPSVAGPALFIRAEAIICQVACKSSRGSSTAGQVGPAATGPSSRAYAPAVAHYLFNFVEGDPANGSRPREQAAAFMQLGMWGIDADERHRSALAVSDLVLIYVGAPDHDFVGRAEVASPAHDWTPSEAAAYPGDSVGGVLLAQVEEWDPPVPMSAVLSQIGPSETAKADFDAGVVRITADEYEAALAVAAKRTTPTG
ncbi:MAG: hypothetical protein ACJ77E_00865 [Gaiellaceae bacterium]